MGSRHKDGDFDPAARTDTLAGQRDEFVETRSYTALFGPLTVSGILYVTDPTSNSFTQGRVEFAGGLFSAGFTALVDGPPVRIDVPGSYAFCLRFDALRKFFVGQIRPPDNSPAKSAAWQELVRVDAVDATGALKSRESPSSSLPTPFDPFQTQSNATARQRSADGEGESEEA
jgi:hypothetical protein